LSSPTLQNQILQALAEIRPLIAQHLGDIEFVKFEEGIVYVRMLGTCTHCPLSQLTIKAGVEELLKSRVPEVIGVEAV